MEETQHLKKRSKYLFGLTCVLGLCALATGAFAIQQQSLSDAVATIFLIATATLAFIEHRVTELKSEMVARFTDNKTKTQNQEH